MRKAGLLQKLQQPLFRARRSAARPRRAAPVPRGKRQKVKGKRRGVQTGIGENGLTFLPFPLRIRVRKGNIFRLILFFTKTLSFLLKIPGAVGAGDGLAVSSVPDALFLRCKPLQPRFHKHRQSIFCAIMPRCFPCRSGSPITSPPSKTTV